MKADDRELVKIQSFVLDSLASLKALLEQGVDMSPDEVRDATLLTSGAGLLKTLLTRELTYSMRLQERKLYTM